MNKSFRKIAAFTFGAMLCLGLTAGPAFAYFTDTVNASGSVALELGSRSEVTEDFDGLNKIVSVKNTGETDALVRVKVFAGDNVPGVSVDVVAGDGWTAADEGWFNYDATLKPGQAAGAFRVNVTATGKAVLDDFDVTVVQQSSQVFGNENGDRIGVFDGQQINWGK